MTRKFVKAGLYTFTTIFLFISNAYQACFADATVFKDFKDMAQSKDGWFFGVGASYIFPSLGNNRTTVSNGIATSPYNLDTYSIHGPDNTNAYSFYGGYRFDRQTIWLPHYSLALRFQHVVMTQLKGSIQQYSLPIFTNYNYNMDVDSDIVNLEGKLDIYQYGRIAPYVSLGLGFASNTVSGYNEQALPGISARESPAYKRHSNTNSMYSLGVGFDYDFTEKTWASLGYEYANLGKSSSGSGIGSWAGQSLKVGTLSTQAVVLGIFYQLP